MVIQHCCLKKTITGSECQSTMENESQEKLADILSRIIKVMRDLQQLATEQSIRSRLYRGDGLERIYQLRGSSRVR